MHEILLDPMLLFNQASCYFMYLCCDIEDNKLTDFLTGRSM